MNVRSKLSRIAEDFEGDDEAKCVESFRLAIEALREQQKKNADLGKSENSRRYAVIADYLESLLEEK